MKSGKAASLKAIAHSSRSFTSVMRQSWKESFQDQSSVRKQDENVASFARVIARTSLSEHPSQRWLEPSCTRKAYRSFDPALNRVIVLNAAEPSQKQIYMSLRLRIFFRSDMYNGIGVQTARGTGTSGHVMKSLGTLRPERHDVRKIKEMRERSVVAKEADPAIIYHNSLRKVEVVLCELRDDLEEEGLSESEIEERVSAKRAELRQRIEDGLEVYELSAEAKDSHTEALEREKRNSKLASALGIRRSRSRSRSYSKERHRTSRSASSNNR
jgi:hypothetical protein